MPPPSETQLYCWFGLGLGLRAKEMAALQVKHVLGTTTNASEEINLTGALTKGRKQQHVYLTNPRVVGAIRNFFHDRQERRHSVQPSSVTGHDAGPVEHVPR